MVNHCARQFFQVFLGLCLLLVTTQAIAIDVTASIDGVSVLEGVPITGTVTVTHTPDQLIDTSTFMIGQAPLSVEKIKDVEVVPGNPVILTIFKFTVDGKPSGLHVLPTISVMVGGKRFSSLASTYDVEKGTPEKKADVNAPVTAPVQSTMEPPLLRLEATVDGQSSCLA